MNLTDTDELVIDMWNWLLDNTQFRGKNGSVVVHGVRYCKSTHEGHKWKRGKHPLLMFKWQRLSVAVASDFGVWDLCSISVHNGEWKSVLTAVCNRTRHFHFCCKSRLETVAFSDVTEGDGSFHSTFGRGDASLNNIICSESAKEISFMCCIWGSELTTYMVVWVGERVLLKNSQSLYTGHYSSMDI